MGSGSCLSRATSAGYRASLHSGSYAGMVASPLRCGSRSSNARSIHRIAVSMSPRATYA